MDGAKYLFWYERAKRSMDVGRIMEHYLKSNEVVEDYLSYVQNEESVKNGLIHLLLDIGFDDTDIEDIMFRYGGTIQNIYLELGLKIGAKLGAEYVVCDRCKEK